MFERFTDHARRTVVLAQVGARELHHDYIGTEHILLGLVYERDNDTARTLEGVGVTADSVRDQISKIIGPGADETPTGHIPFTPRAKKVLELSLREALNLRHNYIGTEHIVLGLLREGEGVAAQVLAGLGVDFARLRTKLTQTARTGGPVPMENPPTQRPRTPAAEQAVAAAEQLAGGSPLGSHHLLEALARSEDSVAARALGALGVDAETLAAKIDELGLEGSSDLTDEEAAARQMEIRTTDDAVEVVLRDPATVELARAVTGHAGGPIRGDDLVSGGLVELHQNITRYLVDVHARLRPAADDDADAETGGGVSRVIRRAMQSRLRRRRG